MALDFTLPLRAVQAVFALIVLGLTGYGACVRVSRCGPQS